MLHIIMKYKNKLKKIKQKTDILLASYTVIRLISYLFDN